MPEIKGEGEHDTVCAKQSLSTFASLQEDLSLTVIVLFILFAPDVLCCLGSLSTF